jgi:prolipoprotein diacylglyceryltransferase
MLPTLIKFGSTTISAFGIFAALAFIFTAYVVWKICRDRGIADEKIIDHLIVTSFTALTGARFVFVLSHWSLFSPNILRILLIWRIPGFSAWGALFVGLAILYLYALKLKLSPGLMLDAYGLAFPIVLFFLSCGLLLDGSLIGRETDLLSGFGFMEEVLKRHPVGLYGLILSLIIGLLAINIGKLVSRKYLPAGSCGLLILSSFGIFELLLAMVRADLLYFRGISVDHILATVLIISPWGPLFVKLNGRTILERMKNNLWQKLKLIHI